jgi:hypothetical protein
MGCFSSSNRALYFFSILRGRLRERMTNESLEDRVKKMKLEFG